MKAAGGTSLQNHSWVYAGAAAAAGSSSSCMAHSEFIQHGLFCFIWCASALLVGTPQIDALGIKFLVMSVTSELPIVFVYMQQAHAAEQTCLAESSMNGAHHWLSLTPSSSGSASLF